MFTEKRIAMRLSRRAPKTFPPRRACEFQVSPSEEEKALSLFQPDILLPAQYFETTRRKNRLEPEKKLMLAVLEDAIWCFQNCLRAQNKRRKGLFDDAEEWIMEEDADWLFSFQNICDVLGLNPEYMREGLTRWKEKAMSGRVKAKVYRLTHVGERKKRTADSARIRGHKLLKASGY